MGVAAGDFWQSPAFTTQTGSSFTTGAQPTFAGDQYYPIVGLICSGVNCATKKVTAALRGFDSTSNVSLGTDSSSVSNSATVSASTPTRTTNCPLGAIAEKITCGGIFSCDSLTLQCIRPTLSDGVWRTTLNGSNTNVGPFSSGSVMCPQGTLLSGITCLTPGGCGSVTLRCAYAEIRVCNPGYMFDSQFNCIGIPCAAVGTTPNGQFASTNGNIFPSNNTLTCAVGYQVTGQGNGVRSCSTTGEWIGAAPTCVGITCNTLPGISNGMFALSNGFTYPTVATYSCNPGYVLSSTNPRSCFYDGSWTNSPVSCTGIVCKAISAPTNCKMNVSNNGLYPATAVVTGKPGYTPNGLDSVSCTTAGTWSGVLNPCIGLPCVALPADFKYTITMNNGGLYPASASVSCNPGYTLTPPNQVFLTCQSNLTWVGSLPSCQPVFCGFPDIPARSNFTTFSNPQFPDRLQSFGSTVCSTCNPGYTANGVLQCQTCGTISKWDNFVWCHPVTCPAPLLVTYATYIFSDSSLDYGTRLTYSCVEGFIYNESTFWCNASAKWDNASYPICTGILCNQEEFATPDCNCEAVTTNNGRYPSNTFFQCKPGYIYASGSTSRVCQKDGVWTNTNLKCVGVPCLPLSCSGQPCAVTYTNNRTFPSTANVTCPAGFRPSISPATSTRCTAAGRWFDSIQCLGIPCRTIPSVKNGFRSISNNGLYPSTVTTTCNTGFLLDKNPVTITCDTEGEWSAPFASCLGVPCDTSPLTTAVQKFNSTNNFTYPDKIVAICNPGYIINNSVFTCSTSGVYCCGPFDCKGRLCNPIQNSTSYSFVFDPPTNYTNNTFFPINVSFTCAPDFYTLNSTSGRCTPDGGWSIPPPKCVRFAIDEMYVNGQISINNTNGTRVATLPNYKGGHSLLLVGAFSTSLIKPTVNYGPSSSLLFPCVVVTWNATRIVCNTSAISYGKSCMVQVHFSQSSVGNLTIRSPPTLVLSHPVPIITLNSLGFFGVEKPKIGWPRPMVASSTKGGDDVFFEGINFSNFSSVVSILYGVSLAELNNVCELKSVNDTVAVCTTTPGEFGPHNFQLTVFDVSSPLSADGYSYPLGPVVKSVYGCDDVKRADNTSETINCPTKGGIKITIEGTTFVDPLTAPTAPTYLVGSTYGLASNYSNSSGGLWRVVLTLPVGTGPAAVVISTNAGQSTARYLITYAQASFTSITGCACSRGGPCPAPGAGPIDCLRTGEEITITGNNFGVRGAIVLLVGVGNCENVTHDKDTPHNKLTCMLPAGYALHVPIAILQLGGFLSFATSPLDISYTQCEPGLFQSGSNTVCGSCTPGHFSSQKGQTICGDCFFGEYSNTYNATGCIAAEEGKFVNSTAAVLSFSCPPGTFSGARGAIACRDCAPGTYTNVSGTQVCTGCEVGKAQAAQGKLQCDFCPPGQFAENSGLLNCLSCTLGTIASSLGSTGCTRCQSGSYGFNTSQCLSCSPGKYMQLEAQTSCLQCDEGYYAGNFSALSCEPCGSGKFMPSKEGSACLPCAPGYFGSSLGLSVCLACNTGTYTNASGLTTCSVCGIGTYGPFPALAACLSCEEGKYIDIEQSEKCVNCPAGTSQQWTGTSFCSDCQSGRYAQDSGWKVCNPCLAGTVAFSNRSTSCTQCPKGTFMNATAGTLCDECQEGFYGPADAQTQCVQCPVGFFMFAKRAEVCLACAIGRAQNKTGSNECMMCDPGRFSDVLGLSVCHLCNPGAYAQSQGASGCDLCAVGTHNPYPAASACEDCDAGYYSSHVASFICDPCPRGTFQAFTRGSACTACDTGTSSNQTEDDLAATSCVACSPGSYAPLSGMYTCSPCEAGKYANFYHSSLCISCAEGSANPLTGQALCVNCQPGYFAETQGVTSCQPCAEGKFSGVTRTIRCSSCPPGTFANESGQSICTDCIPGFFTGLSSSIECEPCSVGFFSGVPRASECVKCPKGTSNPNTGQTDCPDCDAGRYSAVAGASFCFDCVPGKFAQFQRSVACGDCLPGYYVSTPAARVCAPCKEGRYNGRPGAGSCELCQPGTATSQVGSAVCAECLAGQFSTAAGATICINCDAGTYQKRLGSTSCDDCEPAFFSVSGMSTCSECDAGSAMPFSRGKQCRFCDFNGVSAQPPKDCVCNVGYYAPVRIATDTGKLSCVPCPRGVVCSKSGVTMENMEVEAGWWRPHNMSLDMYKCILPSHCLGGHNSVCGTFRVGLVCSLCAEGYAASGSGRTGVCELCKSKGNSVVEVVFLLIALACGLGFLYYLVLRTESTNVKKLQKEGEWWVDDDAAMMSLQTNAMGMQSLDQSSGGDSSGGHSGTPPPPLEARDARDAVLRQLPSLTVRADVLKNMPLTTDSISSSNRTLKDVEQTEEDRLAERRKRFKDSATLTGKVRILVGLLQIGTTIVSTMDIPWPVLFKDFLNLLNFVNLDFVPWQSVGCVAHVSYFFKLYMITAIPIAAFLALVFLYMIPLYLLARRDMSDTEIYKIKREVAMAKFWRLCLFTVFLMYPYVSSSIFRMYVCYNLEGVYYMKMDFEVLCYESEWNAMIGPSTVMILIYPFGIPFVTFLLLYRSRKRLDATDVRVRLGFLYESYNKYNWYFEMVVMINKLFLVAFVGFFPDGMQMPAAMIWLLLYLTIVLLVRPYVRKSDDRLDLFAMSLLVLLCMCGNVLTTERSLDPSTDFVLSLLLIGLFIGVFLVFNVMMVKLLVRKARSCVTARFAEKRKKLMTMARTKRGASSISNSVDSNPFK